MATKIPKCFVPVSIQLITVTKTAGMCIESPTALGGSKQKLRLKYNIKYKVFKI